MPKPTKVTLLAGPYKLAGLFYLPKSASAARQAPGVIVCHGLGSKKENHLGFAEYVAEQGFVGSAGSLRQSWVPVVGTKIRDIEMLRPPLTATHVRLGKTPLRPDLCTMLYSPARLTA